MMSAEQADQSVCSRGFGRAQLGNVIKVIYAESK